MSYQFLGLSILVVFDGDKIIDIKLLVNHRSILRILQSICDTVFLGK